MTSDDRARAEVGQLNFVDLAKDGPHQYKIIFVTDHRGDGGAHIPLTMLHSIIDIHTHTHTYVGIRNNA